MKKVTKALTALTLGTALAIGSGATAFAAVSYPGGGTWDQGFRYSDGVRYTYSSYYHGSKAHTATAVTWNGTSKKYAGPRSWANASIKSSLGGNKTYWNAY